jgi:integrase
MHLASNGKRKRISTGIREFDATNLISPGKLKTIVPDYLKKNAIISKMKRDLELIAEEYFNKHTESISVDELIDQYKERESEKDQIQLIQEEVKERDLIMDYFNEYYDLKSDKFNTGQDFSPESIKEYKSLKYYLEDYQLFLGRKIFADEINYDWLLKFKTFNQTKREATTTKPYKTKGGIRSNTLKKKINLLITFLEWVEEKSKGEVSYPASLRKFSKEEIKAPKIIKDSLSKEEVRKLTTAPFKDEKEKFIRDVFVFSCYTGLRWSDIQAIQKSDVRRDKSGNFFIKKYAIKTDEEYFVYLNEKAFDILNEYGFQLNWLSNPNFNKYLKLYLKNFEEFQEKTQFTEIDQKTKKSRYLYRYEVISIHRGRDTFINMLLNENVPVHTIMRYTGHKSISSLQKYIDGTKSVENYLNKLL